MPPKSPQGKVEYRLDLLDLPDKIVEMIHSPQPPAPEGRQLLDETLRCYQKALEGIRSVLDLEGQKGYSSHMARGLLHVEAIARYRVVACMSIDAPWRKLPVELWDKIFVFYLDDIRIRVGRDKSRRKPPSKPLSLHDYAARFVDPMNLSHFPVEEGGNRGDMGAMNAPCSLLRICKAWKSAVLSTPSIWSDIAISSVAKETAIGMIPFLASSNASRLVTRLRRIVANPMAWSLTIIERQAPQPSTSGPTADDGLPLSSVLVQAEAPLGSIERLKIIVHPSRSATSLGQLDFHSTSSLVISCQDGLERLPRVPNLKRAVLINAVELNKSQMSPDIPWSQLTHLLIRGELRGGQIRGLLTLCTSLRRATFIVQGGEYRVEDSPAWHQVLVGQKPASSTLEALDIVSPRGEVLHLDDPLVDISFPALTKLRVAGPYLNHSQLFRYLQPFHALTHLSLVLCETVYTVAGVEPRYDLGVVLEGCPLLIELVASLQGKLEPLLQEMVFRPDRPRGCHLRVLALLCDLEAQLGFIPQINGFAAAIQVVVMTIVGLVASRGQSHATVSNPAPLERFILRFTDDADFYRHQINKQALVDLIGKAIGTTLQPLVDTGLQLSVESTDLQLKSFYPPPCGLHWDEGAMDFLDEYWEFTASMPPLSSP